VPMR